jgi:hypothetical protein
MNAGMNGIKDMARHIAIEIISLSLLAACLALSGCSTGPVVAAGKDSYMVSVSTVPGATPASAKALIAANQKCASMNKVVVIRNMNDTEAVLFKNEGSATLLFSCVDQNDPEYQRPNLRKDNGVSTIENK